jgi:hypothetical protein
MINRVLLAALMVTAGCITAQSYAQDPVVVSPEIYKVLFENDEIRVLEVTYKPGERDALHSHPMYTVVAETGGTVRIHVPGAEPVDSAIEAHHPLRLDPVKAHWVENTGDTTIRIIAVEFKGPPQEAISDLFYKCVQSSCIYSTPGAQANAEEPEEPEVKQQYFDRCLAALRAPRGSTEHATEMDNCMATYGYFRNAIVSSEDIDDPRFSMKVP